MKDSIKITGTIRAVLRDKAGRITYDNTFDNLIPNAGRQFVIDRLQGAGQAVADYVVIGTSNQAPAVGDTALIAEVARGQGTLSQPDAHTDRVVHTFAAGVGTGDIAEFGRINAASGGVLMGRKALRTAIASSSVANPSVITTSVDHDFLTAQTVTISGHTGSTPDINGAHVITKINATSFSIPVNVTVGGTGGVAVSSIPKTPEATLQIQYDFAYAAG